MIINEVELGNFGPYYGSQSVALGTGDTPLVIIHGENMSGKTSFINAVRWCLYGYAKDRSGQAMPTRRLINEDAFDEGQRRVSVRLHIKTAGGEAIVLRRQRQCKPGVTTPSTERDFEEVLSVEVNGNVLNASEYDDVVNTILPEGISRFFLFDGELLDEYEELVREGGAAQAIAVKQAIELILGVPAATRGRDDLKRLREESDRRYRREAKKHEGSGGAAEALESLVVRRDALLEDKKSLEDQLSSSHAELRTLEVELKKDDDLREDAGRLGQIRQQLSDFKVQREVRRKERRERVAEFWRDALAPRLRHELERLERDRREVDRLLAERAYSEQRRSELSDGLAAGACRTCGQDIDEGHSARLRAEIDELSRRITSLGAAGGQERLDELSGTIKRLRDVAPAGVTDGIRVLERDLKDLTLQEFKAEQRAELLVERLRGRDEKRILEYEEKRQALLQHIASLDHAVREADRQSAEIDAEIAGLRRRLQELNLPGLRKLKREIALLEQLEDLFGLAVNELIQDLRQRVESEATAIFLRLTTDPTYRGLRINDQYGLTIVDLDGRDVKVRSAGAEQVVALSLIGALNQLAVRKGPVIMDTPFGRLDLKHRANILRFVPTLAEQVVLLVHGGEVNRDTDLAEVAGRVSAEYRIDHPSSSRSELTKV